MEPSNSGQYGHDSQLVGACVGRIDSTCRHRASRGRHPPKKRYSGLHCYFGLGSPFFSFGQAIRELLPDGIEGGLGEGSTVFAIGVCLRILNGLLIILMDQGALTLE
ncbi:hypothetical protein AXG93_2294s1310 [Marchantia polymorpha subsp. ruderalis]|uniref:Uncharacterized protein n=1 Tax=Marchantia polymorpha subsp. ruderalis TaxID=1480154 RepID=A0A176WG67_MARPO|nr:hypothetical protein AXG93_2294s1310 [Marchantia polymorpha subsp. ruderalis]